MDLGQLNGDWFVVRHNRTMGTQKLMSHRGAFSSIV